MKETKKFTYEDYIKYTKELALREEEQDYKIEKLHQYKDKGFKLVLEEKEEAVQFINKTLMLENTSYAIEKEEIEKYSSNFITQDFKSKESDIVYKKKDEDIFFLIEQQSKIDYSMAYRILNYCIEIIRSAVDKKKLGKRKYQMPIVYPIVLYTGKIKWDAKRYFEECQVRLRGIQGKNFTSYNLVDINNYTEEELWKQYNFLSIILLLEKANQKDKIAQYLHKIEKEDLNEKEINILIKMIYGSFHRKIGESSIQEFIKKMKNKKGGNDMGLTAFEKYLDNLIEEKLEKGRKRVLKQGMEQGIEQGMKQGMKQGKENGKLEILKKAVKNMIQFGEKDEKIMKYMGIKEEELENIKGMI